MTPSVLVVEDEPAILELLKVNLVDAGYQVTGVPDAETAQAELRNALPSLVLLDWMLPGQSGLALAKQLRADVRTRELPIIMVTARTDEADKVAGLEAWVDDYVTKPFSPRELKARIKAVLRRRAPEAAQTSLEVGPIRLDPVTHRVTVGGPAARRSDRPSSGSCGFCLHARSASIRARNCSIRCGGIMSTSRSVPSTCTSADCAWRSSRSARTG